MYLDLSLVKQHVRADDFSADDEYLKHLSAVAEERVITATRRTEAELTEMNGGEFPMQLKHAMLLLIGAWYDHREAVGTVQTYEVAHSYEALVKPWRKLA